MGNGPHLHRHLGDVDGPEFILYRVVPIRVQFMKEWALTYREVPFNRHGKEKGGGSVLRAATGPGTASCRRARAGEQIRSHACQVRPAHAGQATLGMIDVALGRS
ncbi:MAG: hypothetical protein U0790_07230 [Isosphaeraceae bacterium]